MDIVMDIVKDIFIGIFVVVAEAVLIKRMHYTKKGNEN